MTAKQRVPGRHRPVSAYRSVSRWLMLAAWVCLVGVSGGLIGCGEGAVSGDADGGGDDLSRELPWQPSEGPYGPLADLTELPVFPPDNAWNVPVEDWPVDPQSAALLSRVRTTRLHPDFGARYRGRPFGIPYVVTGPTVEPVPLLFRYHTESDPGPYPIPADAPIEGIWTEAERYLESSADRHLLVVDRAQRKLYEVYAAVQQPDGSWSAGSGAVFDLDRNDLRPLYWTSADAAGLPILPGLIRYNEVAAGAINHALRFTMRRTRRGFVYPARHWASGHTDPTLPPMGMRVRLKANYNISSFGPHTQVILRAMQRYGMILADNGGDMYVSGTPDVRWDDRQLEQLKKVPAQAYEVVQMGTVISDVGWYEDADYGEPFWQHTNQSPPPTRPRQLSVSLNPTSEPGVLRVAVDAVDPLLYEDLQRPAGATVALTVEFPSDLVVEQTLRIGQWGPASATFYILKHHGVGPTTVRATVSATGYPTVEVERNVEVLAATPADTGS